MIKFKSVTYSNLMSVGNTPITVDLESFNKTLITGTNGAGKSTYIEALCFAMYGKPFRNIKKTQIVNAVNKKKLLVEIVFQDNKHVYKIIRGIKPNKFEIYKDDELIPQEAAVADYQDMLEKNILKMSMSTFKQIAVLGTAGFTPFMLLPAGKRREIVEDLLDIGIFSDMAALNKVAIKTLNDQIRDTEADVEKRMSELRLHVEFQKEQQDNRDGDLAQLEARKKSAESELAPLALSITEFEAQISADSKALRDLKSKLDDAIADSKLLQNEELSTLDAEHTEHMNTLQSKQQVIVDRLKTTHNNAQDAIDELQTSELLEFDRLKAEEVVYFDKETTDNTPENNDEAIATLASSIMSIKKDVKALETSRDFYAEHNDCPCPTCNQSITAEFATDIIALTETQIESAKEKDVAMRAELEDAKTLREARKTYIERRASERSALEAKHRTERSRVVNDHSDDRSKVVREQQDDMNELIGNNNDEIRELNQSQSSARAELVAKHAEINADITKADASKREELTKQIGADKEELATVVANERNLSHAIDTIVADIADVKAKAATEDRSELIKTATADIKRVKKALSNDLQTKHCRGIVATLLKDDGVKSMIVKQYIPLINKYINEYLKTMNANYNFVLDEEFNETIKSRGRDDFSYTSFSQGERCRIDLALLFAFRDLVGARTGSMTNLLVLDEVFDSAADTDGVDSINQILSSIQDNVFIISHSEKHEQSMFDKHIKFKKRGNFTREV